MTPTPAPKFKVGDRVFVDGNKWLTYAIKKVINGKSGFYYKLEPLADKVSVYTVHTAIEKVLTHA